MTAIPDPGFPGLEHLYATACRKARSQITTEIVIATVTWATHVLETCNPRNRKRSESLVRRIRDSILGGRWQVNGEPVIFASDGTLLDGQHRLFAIVAAGIAVPVLVVRGVDPSAFSTLDQGKIRNRADVLSIPTSEGAERAKSSTVLAGALSHVFRWENGYLDAMHRFPDNTEILDLNIRHPGVNDSVAQALARCKKGIHPPSLFAALHYIFHRLDAALAKSFFERVWDHIGVEPNSNEAALNVWLENRPSRNFADMLSLLAVVIKCWNRLRTGEPAPGIYKFSDKERFPEIK